MDSNTVREKYIKFFEKKGHKHVPEAPLVLQNDPTTLFNNSGMQQLVPFLMGEKHPLGKKLVDSQGCVRTIDIDEVGDNRHLTYFEMLGNWSLGDYFKEEQLNWIWEFYTMELNLPKERLWITLFEGNDEVPKDEESFEIWKKIGVPTERIHFYPAKKNWWSRAGEPKDMPEGEIGGPDSEVFLEFPEIKHDKSFGERCHPNCDCGRFIEIGNSVFIQYKKVNGKLIEMPQKNVDFGGGLERVVAAVNDTSDVFETDLFQEMIKGTEKLTGKKYGEDEDTTKKMRVIADHVRAARAIAEAGVEPANKLQGYVLRRLIRRASLKMYLLKGDLEESDLNFENENVTIKTEVKRFKDALRKGLKEVEKIEEIDGKGAFDLYQTYGFPLEMTREIFEEKGQKINEKEFEKEFEKHKNVSRSASAGTFKGGLADNSEETVKLHTATHLLHWALREVLGKTVRQEGSNITAERLRFDFAFGKKLTEDQIQKVENMINEKIEEKLPVTKTIEDKDSALESGALSFFREKYPEKVNVYTIGKDPKDDWVSKEFCGGPHVKNTSEIGRVRIKKQEKIGANLMRIYAEIN